MSVVELQHADDSVITTTTTHAEEDEETGSSPKPSTVLQCAHCKKVLVPGRPPWGTHRTGLDDETISRAWEASDLEKPGGSVAHWGLLLSSGTLIITASHWKASFKRHYANIVLRTREVRRL